MNSLKDYIPGYLSFRASKEGESWTSERERKRRLLQRTFSEEMLRKASDEEFAKKLAEALSSLWTLAMWRNLDQHINKIIEQNGVKKLREMFYALIYGNGPFEKRFDNFLDNVWGLGSASVAEILCFVRPERYAIWNRRVALALEKLGLLEDLARTLGVEKDKIKWDINGYQYVKIIEFLDKLRTEIEQVTNQRMDFLELDYFLYYVAEVAEIPVVGESRGVITSHEEAQYYLLKLGQLLGYDTHVAKQDQGRIVNNERLGDVAGKSELPEWLTLYPGIRNLEDIDVLWLDPTGRRVVYAFEVSHTTDIAKDAISLSDIASIAEVTFIVAGENRRREFERLRNSAQFKELLKQGKLRFISYDELLSLYNGARSFRELLDKVGIHWRGAQHP